MNSYSSTPHSGGLPHIAGERRLLVKVIRASQLGSNQGSQQPFCVVEVDEPPQKNQTSIQKNTDSPVWEEHFLL